MPIHQKHINQLFQMAINRLNSFLNNLVSLQGKLIVAPFFFLHSYHTTNPAYRKFDIIFKNTHISTVKNWIHFLCKNNWSNFAPVGFVCIVSPQGVSIFQKNVRTETLQPFLTKSL